MAARLSVVQPEAQLALKVFLFLQRLLVERKDPDNGDDDDITFEKFETYMMREKFP
jgi:hypothetical protein